ncbi:MAG TPA: hypothetical protein VHB54_03600 [Mucilaginibacter sp.]|nr:hypothetical protein [Mucilaginibacter sp.]
MITTDWIREIWQKRRAEVHISQIARHAKQSLKAYHAGKTIPSTAVEAIKKLEARDN